MNKPLHQFFTEDHERIEGLLEQAITDPDQIDLERYRKFRIGLLTHIKMEENILFPAAKKANGGKPLPNFQRFRMEHGAITTLMAVHPNREVIKVIRHILDRHDLAEEEPGGMYDVCENLTKAYTEELLEELKNIPPTPVHPPKKEDYVLEAAKRVVKRAGYDYDGIVAGNV